MLATAMGQIIVKLTASTDYALRVLIHVGLQKGSLVRMVDVADSFDISANHLTKVVHRLAQLEYLETVQGRHGGMRLARSANSIIVGKVVSDMEPDFNVVQCLEAEPICCIAPVCRLKNAMQRATRAFLNELDKMTLADLLVPQRPLKSLLGLADAQIIVQR